METPTPMLEANGPGWTLYRKHGDDYWLWAPREETEHGGKPRHRWSACWQSEDQRDGDFVRGDTLDNVLRIFPVRVRELFRKIVEEAGLTDLTGQATVRDQTSDEGSSE